MTGINIFELVDLDENASSIEIQKKIDETKKRAARYKDKTLFERIIKALEFYKKRALERERLEELAKEAPRKTTHLSKEVEDALEYFSTEKEETPKKKKKSYRLQKAVIAAGILAILLTSGNRIHNNVKAKDMQNNVCIEYIIQEGDSYNWVDDHFRDYSVIHTQFIGPNYNFEYLYEDDTIIARTTLEEARELEARGVARIISIDEAIEILEQTGSSLVGKFKEYKENELNNESFVFFEPSYTHSI